MENNKNISGMDLNHLPGMGYRCLNDKSWTMKFASKKCFELTGYTPDELIDNRVVSYEDLILPEFRNELWYKWQVAISNKTSIALEYKIKTKEGKIKWVFEQGEAVFSENGEVVFLKGFISDITEQKKTAKEKGKLQNQLIKSQKMETIGNLAGGVAHDFNNILSLIIGHSELLLKDVKDEKVKMSLNAILSEASRTKELVQQRLSISRNKQFHKEPVYIQNIVKEIITLLKKVLPKNIEIIQFLHNCGMVMADQTQLQQVVMNLCINSCHSMGKTGGELEIELKEASSLPIEFSESDKKLRYAVLTVSDTGSSIKKELLDKIFEPYFTTKDKEKETGLGLSMVGIIENHKGHISVSSELNKGTAFKVYLPLETNATAINNEIPPL